MRLSPELKEYTSHYIPYYESLLPKKGLAFVLQSIEKELSRYDRKEPEDFEESTHILNCRLALMEVHKLFKILG
jgi:hypothetical protein